MPSGNRRPNTRSIVRCVLAALTVVPAHPHALALTSGGPVWSQGRTLHALGGPVYVAPKRSRIVAVAASPARVALLTRGFFQGLPQWTSLRAGPPEGPFALVAGRERGSSLLGPQRVAVADGGLVTVDRLRTGLRALWRPDGGAPVALRRVEDDALTLAAAGSFAALGSDGSVTEYALPLPARTLPTRGLARVAVAADGTLAFLDGRGLFVAGPSGAPVLVARRARAIAGLTPDAVGYVLDAPHRRVRAYLAPLDAAYGLPRPITPPLRPGALVATDGATVAYTTPGRLHVVNLRASTRSGGTFRAP